jgi:regulator of replication initiation timing
MTREEHEAILNELLTPELETSRRTELLQQLRVQHGTDLTEFDSLTQNNQKLTTDNQDLIISNSKLFRQIGIGNDQQQQQQQQQQTVSETITIEQLEKG